MSDPQEMDTLVALADHQAEDYSTVRRGEVGRFGGWRGQDVVVAWRSGAWSTVPAGLVRVVEARQHDGRRTR